MAETVYVPVADRTPQAAAEAFAEALSAAAAAHGQDVVFQVRPHVVSPWIPASPDGLPPASYPKWREQEQRRRAV